MNLPAQARPVVRTSAPRSHGNRTGGVLPSGNCSSNYWCCTGVNGAGPTCYPCHSWLGYCTTPQASFCQALGGHISDQCPA